MHPLVACGFSIVLSLSYSFDALVIYSRQLELFVIKIRPVLIQHCYQCHSEQADQVEGGLRLDLKSGWQLGGDSGQPAIVPGDPERSPLLLSIRHADGSSAMPPKQP
ncbi:MAG TPA: hypothetical protein DCF63_09390, partial [Planctomycetaceae bacterium]|nr:hypothetical protein [Planctomycetaceae bacterium]